MGSINKNEITAEMMKKAMECKTADELVELAKSEGFEITKEEAEKYLEELGGTKLDDEDLDMVAGGRHSSFMSHLAQQMSEIARVVQRASVPD